MVTKDNRPGQTAKQFIQCVKGAKTQPGMKKQLTHDQEQGNGDEGESGQRIRRVPDQLRQSGITPHEQHDPDNVSAEKGKRDRQTQCNQENRDAEHQGKRDKPDQVHFSAC